MSDASRVGDGEASAGGDGEASAPGERERRARGAAEGDPDRLAGRRSQLVLVAAGVIAVGLLPIVLAYTQLGYAGVATVEPTATTPTEDARQAIERAAFDASVERQGARPWSARDAVASDVGARFDARIASIEDGRLEQGVVHEVERNQSAAANWASANCPGGPNRQFGPCAAQDGVVLQERAGDTHVVAIAMDLRTVSEGATYDGTYVLDAEVGGRAV